MKLIVGLGNPGEKYMNNRHNVGHMFIDYIKTKNSKLKAIKTDCFMNESGKFVKKSVSGFPNFSVSDLIVIHDDLDIPLGKFRIDLARGPKLHNGLKSIETALRTKDFWRIRIGVDNRQKTGSINGETYVLKNFLADERELIDGLFPTIYSQLSVFFK